MSLPSRGGNHAVSAMNITTVLQEIKQAQDNLRHGYEQALGEVRAGHKQTCWIWYVWPCLAPVRTTSKPQYSLPNLEAASAYLKDKVLRTRLREITEVAVEHLNGGMKAELLLGGFTDAHKFHESVTCFAIAAAELGDQVLVKLFISAVQAFNGKLEGKVMEYITNNCGLRKYHGIKTSQELSDMLATCPKACCQWNLVGPVHGGIARFDQIRDKERFKDHAHNHDEQATCRPRSRLMHLRKASLSGS